MLKNFIKGNFMLIFAVCFAIPVVVLLCFTFADRTDYKSILENGVETTGYIVENSATSSTSINDVSYYSIKYYFKDENLNEHSGKTSESYTYYEVSQMEKKGTILIKYDPRTFDSIEANYDPSKDEGTNILWLFLVIFGIIDIVLWVVVIKVGKHNLILAKVEREGKEYSANVTGITTNLVVNGVHKYKVHYTWIGDSGLTMEGSSTSKYYYDEAAVLERAKSITIKAIGKNSVIMTTPDMCLNEHYNNYSDGIADDLTNSKPEELKCDYCGHHITKEDDYCSNCGAKVNIYK